MHQAASMSAFASSILFSCKSDTIFFFFHRVTLGDPFNLDIGLFSWLNSLEGKNVHLQFQSCLLFIQKLQVQQQKLNCSPDSHKIYQYHYQDRSIGKPLTMKNCHKYLWMLHSPIQSEIENCYNTPLLTLLIIQEDFNWCSHWESKEKWDFLMKAGLSIEYLTMLF